MLSLTPDKLPEKYVSTICCDVCTFVLNKSFQVLKSVATEDFSNSSKSKFGPANVFVGSGIALG